MVGDARLRSLDIRLRGSLADLREWLARSEPRATKVEEVFRQTNPDLLLFPSQLGMTNAFDERGSQKDLVGSFLTLLGPLLLWALLECADLVRSLLEWISLPHPVELAVIGLALLLSSPLFILAISGTALIPFTLPVAVILTLGVVTSLALRVFLRSARLIAGALRNALRLLIELLLRAPRHVPGALGFTLIAAGYALSFVA